MATPNANKTQMSDMLPYIFPFLRFDSLDFKWVPLYIQFGVKRKCQFIIGFFFTFIRSVLLH